MCLIGFPAGLADKGSACNEGDTGSIPGSGRSPGGGMAIHSSIPVWKNPMDRGAWWAIVQRVAKSRIQPSMSTLSEYIFETVMSSCWIDSFITVSCTLFLVIVFKFYFVWYKYWTTFFLFPFAWNTFFHPLTFSQSDVKWVSFRQHIYRSYFHIHSVTLSFDWNI